VRDFQEEYLLYDKLEKEMQGKPSTERVLQYAILLYYYPFTDLKKATDLLWEFGQENKFCMLLGCFYCCYYNFDEKPQENKFLDWLLKNIHKCDRKTQALVYMMEGVCEGLQTHRQESLRLLRQAEMLDEKCAAIYMEIIFFAQPYSKMAKEARRKVKQIQSKMSLEELENMTLEERISFSFFMEMEIRKNIKRPIGFVEEWK
jgi:hypothetical protein